MGKIKDISNLISDTRQKFYFRSDCETGSNKIFVNTVLDAFKAIYFFKINFLADSEYPLTDVGMVRWVSV